MSRVCEVCGKGPVAGRMINYRGLSKKKGGIGLNITGITARRFLPNIQKIKVNVKGTVRRMKICTSCLKLNKINKA